MPRVPRAFCLMAIAIRFFSALVSLRAASIFKLTSLCSLRASRRFSARVPMPSSLDTCSSLCKFVIESVPMSTYTKEDDSELLRRQVQAFTNLIFSGNHVKELCWLLTGFSLV